MTARTTLAALLGGVAALAALPAAAQDFCGGASANGQWIGGTEAASDVATAASHMEQMALVLMGNEYVALFSASAPTEVRLEAEGRGAGDPVIDLRDEAGTIVASDDDSGGEGASRAETLIEPGRYCLSMRSYDGSPMTGFVRVGRLEHEALTAGLQTGPDVTPDGPDPVAPDPALPDPALPDPALPDPALPDPAVTDPALPVQPGGICDASTITAYLGEGGAIDGLLGAGGATATASVDQTPYWGFTLDAPAAVSITAENPDADPVITLYDEYGSYLAENDDYDGLNSRIDMAVPLQPGTYCIATTALTDTTLPITVAVEAYDAQAAQVGLYERGEASPPLDGSYPVTQLGTLGNRLRSDIQSTDVATWFAFDVAEGGLVLIEAVTNGAGDPTLVLFDDFGRQIAYNDDNGDSLDSLVTARVLPGTYLVGVRQLGAGSQALTRMLFERYVPAP
jgi:hypothetical protein